VAPMGNKKHRIAQNPLFALPYLAVANHNHKKKKLKVLRKRKKGNNLDLDAAEAEIRELGFLDGGVPETGYRCPQCSRTTAVEGLCDECWRGWLPGRGEGGCEE